MTRERFLFLPPRGRLFPSKESLLSVFLPFDEAGLVLLRDSDSGEKGEPPLDGEKRKTFYQRRHSSSNKKMFFSRSGDPHPCLSLERRKR